MSDDSYLRCSHGLHTQPKPFATHMVVMFHNPLANQKRVFMCEECSEKRLKGFREEFGNVEVFKVGMVRR